MVIDAAHVQQSGMSQLRAQGITFSYDRRHPKPLFYDVSLDVHAGEMVGLLGPNGSGKTTLLRLLSGVLQPQAGHIELEGRTLQQWGRRGAAQRIAVVPQELHVPFAFTVEHMVGLGRTPFIRGFFGTLTAQDEAVMQDAMAAAGVTPLAQRVFNELSGGERQRVMIAMALAQQPLLLLLDEPTAHLDIKYQIETLELVQRLNAERNVTVIAAMHDLNLAARYFPRLLLFQRGIVADASPAEVLESALLSRVYGVQVQVGILRGTQHLSVLPPGSVAEEERPALTAHQLRVHVIAGGGSGEVMMRALADAHIPFTAGALNVGDSDHTLALRLADEVITEQPYAPISQANLDAVCASLTRASALILCPTPIGPGNLALLREAVQASLNGLPVFLLAPGERDTDPAETAELHDLPENGDVTEDELMQRTGMMARDYTSGEGLMYLRQLLRNGAVIALSVSMVVETLKKRFIAVYT